MSITPDYNVSIDFLRRFHPGRPWLLVAIEPKQSKEHQNKIEADTFDAARADDCRRWLARQGNKHWNLYFSVAEPIRELQKKSSRTDISRVWFLHADLDPRIGDDPEQERVRILKSLREYNPPPTLIVNSGGGAWGFWALNEPVEIGGDLARAEETALFNLRLCNLLGALADNVQNIDRIARLPGSVNYPDYRKVAKQRTEALAEIVEAHWDDPNFRYGIGQFAKEQVAQSSSVGRAAALVNISANVARLADVNDLPKPVSGKTKEVICHGCDPDEPGKFGGSRSEWLFHVCCELVRADCSDDQIHAVITDPKFRISDSVLDKRGGKEKYARRQIARAREFAIDPDLQAMNDRFSVIGNWGGKCRIAEWQNDEELGRSRLTKQGFEDFKNRFINRRKVIGQNSKGDDITKGLGEWWFLHPKRMEYEKIVFAPLREVPSALNLWQGFAVEPRPGDCAPFLRFLLDIICAGNKWHYRYLVRWLARVVQKPGEPGQTAVVMKGLKGIGKSFLADAIGSLLGRHYMTISDAKHFTGSFNAHLRDVVLLLADEAFYAGNRQHEATLKRIITARDLTIEGKGLDVETSANCLHIMLASNSDWVVPASWDERRFFVLKPSPAKRNDTRYFGALDEWLKGGGREALLHYLMNRSMKPFNVRAIPDSEGLREQKNASKDAPTQWIELLAEEGILPANITPDTAFSNHPDKGIDGLYADARKRIPDLRFASDKRLGGILTDWGCKRYKNGGRGWQFPPLAELRAAMDAKYGPREWPEGEGWAASPM